MITFPTLPTARLTSKFGWRIHPITGVRTFHHGIDLAPEVPGTTGVPVYAAQDGKVVRRTFNSTSGNYIMIQHTADSYTTHYLHLDSFLVALNDDVVAGQQIGIMGMTGGSTGIHLDFGVSKAFPTVFGSPGTYVDPQVYLTDSHEPDPDYPIIWGDEQTKDFLDYALLFKRNIPRRKR